MMSLNGLSFSSNRRRKPNVQKTPVTGATVTIATARIPRNRITAISRIGDTYTQNVTTLEEYDTLINKGKIPVYRGIKLDSDDLLRRDVITQLICHFKLEFSEIEDKHRIDFNDYFYNEIQTLKIMENDGLLTLDPEKITISLQGRLLIRNICMVFDKYLRQAQSEQVFSRVI